MGTPLDFVLDNPIVVKHYRSRLRPSAIVPGIVVVLLLCVLFTWIGFQTGTIGSGATLYFLSSISFLILVLGGSNQVAMSVGSAKESGILDFHRITPVPAATNSLGFFLGGPIREYLLFALVVPFMAISAASSTLGLGALFNVLAPTILTAWLAHSLSILLALVAKKPRNASVGVIVLILLCSWIGSAIYGTYRGSRLMMAGTETDPGGFDFFGVRLPTIAFLALYQGAAIVFFLIAGTRKMRAERALPFSKPEALACMATFITLALGACWTVGANAFIVPVLLYAFVAMGIILSATVTPDSGEYAKGVRRAVRAGHRRPPIWADAASNAWAVYALAGLVALGVTIAWEAIELVVTNANDVNAASSLPLGRLGYSQTIAIGVFTVAYYGLGKQFFALKFARRGETYFRLFLFLVWVVPIVVGIAAGVTFFEAQGTQVAMGVSPWAGMILSIKGGPIPDTPAADTVRFMALLPSLSFAFLFNFLLTNEQRRIDRHLRETTKVRAEAKPDLILTEVT